MTPEELTDDPSTAPFDDPLDAAQWFSNTARVLTETRGREATLQRVVELARDVVGVDLAAVVTLDRENRPTLLAATDDCVAEKIVHAQRVAGAGPTWEALLGNKTVVADDLTLDQRWPVYRDALLADTEVRSVMTFCLLVGDRPHGALALYSKHPNAFGEREQRLGAIYADHAAFALSEASEADHAANLQTALSTSRTIGAALGILMERHHVTADEAFAMLRRESQHSNRKLSDVAETVVQTGEFPPPAS
ncbi:GAF and ANTAR domain-containing protein [Nakamurella panacisegetis]|uniref:GAF and ANTAR domain-containing protein n=1 Tax=Nakamurella panacisegetis TaxID=1090615 RepID=UPI0015612860|nr:GAF and ANTAR domain-containing protein [Nakamurella panacisegetis]